MGLNITPFAPVDSPIFSGHPTIEGVTSTGASGTGKSLYDTGTIFGAGSASAGTKPKLTSGTILTSPEAGAIEYDGNVFYLTGNTTSGREQNVTQAHYLMTADGSVSNTASITDMFPANSSFATATNGIYEFVAEIFFLKTTGGTMVFTLTNTQNYTSAVGSWMLTNASTGVGGGGATFGGAVSITGAATIALIATASLTTAINQYARIRFMIECATAGNIRLRGTPSAGTFTMLRDSCYTVKRLGSATVGSFVA